MERHKDMAYRYKNAASLGIPLLAKRKTLPPPQPRNKQPSNDGYGRSFTEILVDTLSVQPSLTRKKRLPSRNTRTRRKTIIDNELRKLQAYNIIKDADLLDPTGNSAEKDTPFNEETDIEDMVTLSNLSDAKKRKLQSIIHLHHLTELMKVFRKSGEGGQNRLKIDEFKAAFSKIVGGDREQDIATMFMKIDAECGGTIDWSEFCTYLLLEYQERETMVGKEVELFPYPMKILQSTVREVTKITFLPTTVRRGDKGVDGRYVTIGRDGTVTLWNKNLTLHKVMMIDGGKLPWVTDMVLLPNASKMIVALSDNVLSLYDFTGGNICEHMMNIIQIPFTVLTMHYWYHHVDPNRAILIMGDSGGGVCVMEFNRAMAYLFIHPAGNCNLITFHSLLTQTFEGVTVSYFPKVHRDWVAKVAYWPIMGYVMSCSNDDDNSLHLVDLNGRTREASIKIRKGILSFDFCMKWNIIATGGLDRILRFWNPYITGKPIASLKGHLSAIMHVSISSREHVFSLSKDMELRVWKISDQMCLQIVNRCNTFIRHPPSAFYVNKTSELVLIGSTHLGALQTSTDDDYEQDLQIDRNVTHDHPLCAALYNHNFNQVVSGCHGSVVCVWDVDTGEKILQFSGCHGHAEITAMAFDGCGRRLLTGGKDGSLKIWNFNNGACLHVLRNMYSNEITSIASTCTKIVIGGWSRLLTSFDKSGIARGDDDNINNFVPKYIGRGVHKEDILCLAHTDAHMLASASYDGDIFLWNTEVDKFTQKLDAWEEKRRLQRGQKRKSIVEIIDDIQARITAKTHTSEVLDNQDTGMRGFHPPEITSKDRHAIERMAFLPGRELDMNSASLVACGTGGYTHMWNINGGGLLGEFNIWNTDRQTVEEEDMYLHSVTSLMVDKDGVMMLTGDSMGFIQTWIIDEYCLKVRTMALPITTPPPHGPIWKAHTSSVVSIDGSWKKGVLVTASTDLSVRLWSTEGRYIGTFGEKHHWSLTYPLRSSDIPRRIPAPLKKSSSFSTLQVVTGFTPSKWKIAKNLFKMLRQAKQEQKKKESKFNQNGLSTESYDAILGRHYQRKTRFRVPMVPMKLVKDDAHLFNIYGKLKCLDIAQVDDIPPPKPIKRTISGRIQLDGLTRLTPPSNKAEELLVDPLPHNPHTTASLSLPPLRIKKPTSAKVTSGNANVMIKLKKCTPTENGLHKRRQTMMSNPMIYSILTADGSPRTSLTVQNPLCNILAVHRRSGSFAHSLEGDGDEMMMLEECEIGSSLENGTISSPAVLAEERRVVRIGSGGGEGRGGSGGGVRGGSGGAVRGGSGGGGSGGGGSRGGSGGGVDRRGSGGGVDRRGSGVRGVRENGRGGENGGGGKVRGGSGGGGGGVRGGSGEGERNM